MNRTEYLLASLGEECGEVQQRIGKALRFGLDEIQAGQPLSNAERIGEELTDLLAIVNMLIDDGALPQGFISWNTMALRRAKIEHWLSYARTIGNVE